MPVKIKRFEVAFLANDEHVEHTVEVWGVDRLRAEREGRKIGLKGQKVRVRSGRRTDDDIDVDDMGDLLQREALEMWAACVRLGLYAESADAWRNRDFIGSEKAPGPGGEADADPTPPGLSTGDA